MFEECQPEYWMFGHYHLDRTFKIGRTEFTCLNELSTKEIVLTEERAEEEYIPETLQE